MKILVWKKYNVWIPKVFNFEYKIVHESVNLTINWGLAFKSWAANLFSNLLFLLYIFRFLHTRTSQAPFLKLIPTNSLCKVMWT